LAGLPRSLCPPSSIAPAPHCHGGSHPHVGRASRWSGLPALQGGHRRRRLDGVHKFPPLACRHLPASCGRGEPHRASSWPLHGGEGTFPFGGGRRGAPGHGVRTRALPCERNGPRASWRVRGSSRPPTHRAGSTHLRLSWWMRVADITATFRPLGASCVHLQVQKVYAGPITKETSRLDSSRRGAAPTSPPSRSNDDVYIPPGVTPPSLPTMPSGTVWTDHL
jgi:hypothetical protein